MKEVRSLIRWMLIVMILLLPLAMQAQEAFDGEYNKHEVKGKISWEIEKKTMTLQEAQAAIGKATTLKVYMVFEGEWVGLLDQGLRVKFSQSSFSYGIAQGESATAPLYKNDPPANMGAKFGACSWNAYDSKGFVQNYGWQEQKTNGVMRCPTYDYGLVINGSDAFTKANQNLQKSADGTAYKLYAFDLTFYLKNSTGNVYVRGIDDQGTYVTDNSSDLYATSGINEINIVNNWNTVFYWPGTPNTQRADWTQAPTDYYGGVIPGGIFIEQSPEVAQLTPDFLA